jgi:hypothetical protein
VESPAAVTDGGLRSFPDDSEPNRETPLIHRRAWPLLLLAVLGCVGPLASEGDDYELADADLRVAFVGNSLTYTHDIPGMVQALADAQGRSMSHVSITAPNASLEDHWYRGTQEVIRDLEPDVVVMQQGPSSLSANQIHLARWAEGFADVIREVGGEPALYMVWPSDARRGAFGAVWDAYKGAADRVEGLFIPAGQTWVEAWALDPDLAFYGGDGFHPSPLGALAAAQTIYAVLHGLPADSVPSLELGFDRRTLATLRAALAASLESAGDSVAPSSLARAPDRR